MCKIYKIFAEPWDCDFSQQAMEEMFLFESKGIGDINITGFNATGKKPNGYAVGKKWSRHLRFNGSDNDSYLAILLHIFY